MAYYLRLKLRGHRQRATTGFNLVGGRKHFRLGNKRRGQKQVKFTGLSA